MPKRAVKARSNGKPEGSGRKPRKRDETAGNLPYEPLRWTISRAALEFRRDGTTISKRLREIGADMGADKCYSTGQIAAACYGDIDLERARKVRAEAEQAERNNAREGETIIDLPFAVAFCMDMGVALKHIIKGFGLSKEQEDEALNEIADLFDANKITEHLKSPEDRGEADEAVSS